MSPSPIPAFRADDGHSIGVLLVTPNSRLRVQLREKLRPPQWNLTEAAGGAEALECLHEVVSEILLLDPLLPDLEPAEFSTMVREQFPGVQILTVNAHTGQPVLGTSSPTALSAQLSQVLSCALAPPKRLLTGAIAPRSFQWGQINRAAGHSRHGRRRRTDAARV